MKKLLSILLIVSLMCACTITAYADETTEPIETPSEPSELPSEPSEPESEPITPTEPSEPSEPSSEPSEPIAEPEQTETETGEPDAVEPEQAAPETTTPEQLETPTVNVSQESINAIAEAVAEDETFTMTFNNITYKLVVYPYNSGEEYVEHMEDFLRALTEVPYWTLNVSQLMKQGRFSFFMDYNTHYTTLTGTGDNYMIRGTDEIFDCGFDASRGIFYISGHRIGNYGEGLGDMICWSNFNILSPDKTFVVHQSDVPISYPVNFVTGFDDLTVESMTSLSFNAPVLTYDGYRFDGWYLDEEFTQPYTSDYVFLDATTLYAKWTKLCYVSIVTGFDDYVIDPIATPMGEPFHFPLFEYPDYDFTGAYASDDFNAGSHFVSGSIVNEDITLYLHFEKFNNRALYLQMVDRLEGIVYVQIAAIIMLIALLIVSIFFKRGHGAS